MDKNFESIKIGHTASFEKLITEKDVAKFAEVSGDCNPLHLNKKYAAKTKFKGRIVHGMFLGALVSRLIGMQLPGKRALLIKARLEFKKPARVGDKILVKGRVIHHSPALKLLEIAVEIRKNREILVTGAVHTQVMD